MPKKGEKERKLKLLSAGKGVRPPKKWFRKLKKEIEKEYPNYGVKRVSQIVGGIWSKEPTTTKKAIVRKYQV